MAFFSWAQEKVRKFSIRRPSLEDESGKRASKPNDPKVPGVTVKSKSLTDKNQFILAGSVLLLIFSCVSLVFTIKTIVPGLHSRHLQETNCTVIDSIYNGKIMCPVTNLSDRGCTPKMNCLEIFVSTNPNYGDKTAYLLHQNEYSFVTDLLPCSYHPPQCTCNTDILNNATERFNETFGLQGNSFSCFQSTKNPQEVTMHRIIKTSDMAHSIFWPLFGIILSVWSIVSFAKKNNSKINRLYIYNYFGS
ncbi:Oidioi.mRNA.OKI2018_I69.PAR.g9184.t1.cds [Oikopleura dioica]|uniref:Oidioi.mRNA.OKI2018_I69.PAR.g9184.t1.cds n=1 Tax=Oikopleura dioica TaxID=34765 RepID=A0ABN7RMS2_OIKDI|nr:Oidioi.mRNA.OKI2018_I69.PAR.g9184.t1.cds [Oikopleura dioica]